MILPWARRPGPQDCDAVGNEHLNDYLELLHGEGRPASLMRAVLPADHRPPDPFTLRTLIEGSGVRLDHYDVIEPRTEGAPAWMLEVHPAGGDGPFRVWSEGHSGRPLPNVDRWPLGARSRARQSSASVFVETVFGDGNGLRGSAAAAWHRQLRLLLAASPDVVAVHDISAQSTLSPARARVLADCAVPPGVRALLTVHHIADAGAPGWLHTHGLLRCGVPELEVFHVPEAYVTAMGDLIEITAALMVDRGLPAPDESFEIGPGLGLIWLPWQEAVARPLRGAPPHRSEAHQTPSAVLFRRSGRWLWRRYQAPLGAAERLAGGAVHHLPEAETERRAALARLRLDRFRALFERHGTEDDWVFLLKVGYPVEGGVESEREHLWFRLDSFTEDGRAAATLLNQPRFVSELKEGQRTEHALERVTDWTVLRDQRPYGPDEVFQLEGVCQLEGEGERH